MHKELSFIHAADLHLGPPLRGIQSDIKSGYDTDTWTNRILEATFNSFEKAVDLAILKGVNFFIISGDTFDTTDVDYADYARFSKSMSKLAANNIEVYMCAGNHDPINSWNMKLANLPKNVHFFTANKPCSFVYQTANQTTCFLDGISYADKEWPSEHYVLDGFENPTKNMQICDFAIGVMHSCLDIGKCHAPVSKNALINLNYDYWALGHVHKNLTFKEKNCVIAYPGCIQGLHINAKGTEDQQTKGAFGVNYVKMTKSLDRTVNNISQTQVQFCPTSQVLWKKIFVDLEKLSSVSQIVQTVCNKVEKARSTVQTPYVCTRVYLTGFSELHNLLQSNKTLEGICKEINMRDSNCLCDEVVDLSQRPWDVEAMLADNLFPAKIIDAARKISISEEEIMHRFSEELQANNIAEEPGWQAGTIFEDAVEQAAIYALDSVYKQ